MSTSLIHDRIFKPAEPLQASRSLGLNLLLSFGFAALTGLMAQISIPLAFSPVPITGQTFAVLLSGALLGSGWGALSQVLYVSLSFAGIPWLAGLSQASLLSPSFGYMIGFVFAALAIGWWQSQFRSQKGWHHLFILFLIADLIIIMGSGIVWLAAWYRATLGEVHLTTILVQGYLPFIPGEIFKCALVASAARPLKRSFAVF